MYNRYNKLSLEEAIVKSNFLKYFQQKIFWKKCAIFYIFIIAVLII